MTELFFKVLDFILGGLLEKRRKGKALSEQFGALRRHILYENVTNYISVHLAKLRKLPLDSGLVERPEFKAFFGRWLTNPFLGQPAAGMFSKEQLEEPKQELSRLQL
jgi:hypothetical protein